MRPSFGLLLTRIICKKLLDMRHKSLFDHFTDEEQISEQQFKPSLRVEGFNGLGAWVSELFYLTLLFNSQGLMRDEPGAEQC